MDVSEWLDQTFFAPDYRPPTPPRVAFALLELAQRPDVSALDVTELLEQDPILAGRVLKLVQSPFYAGRVHITSLEAAVVRIGLRTLQEVVWEVALDLRLFADRDRVDALERVRRHCVASAYIAREIARVTRSGDDRPFLAGLLHDVGAAAAILQVLEEEGRFDLEASWPAIRERHAAWSARMIERWDLPAELADPVRRHHDPGEDEDGLASLVCVADAIAADLGRGLTSEEAWVDATDPAVLDAAFARLGLDERKREQLLEDVEQALDRAGI